VVERKGLSAFSGRLELRLPERLPKLACEPPVPLDEGAPERHPHRFAQRLAGADDLCGTHMVAGVGFELGEGAQQIVRRVSDPGRRDELESPVAKRLPWLLEAVLEVTAREQRNGGPQRMSTVLWDVFTGSAPYREIARPALDPRLVAVVLRESGRSIGRRLTKGVTNAAVLEPR
jgi:hypothetical protein